jgi:hypothetical protein
VVSPKIHYIISRDVKMIKILSRLFDSFSRRIFDYSTGFSMVTLKFSYIIYYIYIVPLNIIHRIRVMQATSEHI